MAGIALAASRSAGLLSARVNRASDMANSPLKIIALLVALAAVGFSFYYARRTAPACAAGGKFVSSLSDCQAWGFSADACKQAVEKARAVAARAAPKTENQFQCELRFTDCFANPAGGFTPSPAFCLAADNEPKEIRYIEYESDRRNRRQTKSVPIN
jgi:uncharacterized protein YgiB involved in biofilm formation